MRNRPEPSAEIYLETLLPPAIYFTHFGDCAQVVHQRQTAGVAFTAGKSNLELAPEILRIGMPKHKVGHPLRIGSDVEGLVGADTRLRAGSYIANDIAASLL